MDILALTRRFSNSELVTLAVYLLGGSNRYADTEDIAMKTQELAPGRFTWRKYPDQINLELVRVRLSEAKSDTHGALLRGSGTKGWTLTAKGLEWASTVAQDADALKPEVRKQQERGGSVDSHRLDRARDRVYKCAAWSKWPSSADGISLSEAEEVFRIDGYATEELRLEKIDRLRKTFIGQSDLLAFIGYLEKILAKARS